ncbi:MAG: DNA alkylation repair protein [bacterium]
MSPSNILSHLKKLRDPARATHSLRFFKTGVGEYGEGDKFLGLTVPQIRSTVNQYWRTLSLKGTILLLHNSFHEARLTALLILVAKYQHHSDQKQIYQLYLANTSFINNWDLVDSSAHKIIGDYLLTRPRDVLYRLVKSKSLWERRISIIATFAFIAQGDYADALHLAQLLRDDSHDLIHKAVGWTLREVGKKDQTLLLQFLDTHAGKMPRTMLRYAIEKLTPSARQHYLRSAIPQLLDTTAPL